MDSIEELITKCFNHKACHDPNNPEKDIDIDFITFMEDKYGHEWWINNKGRGANVCDVARIGAIEDNDSFIQFLTQRRLGIG